MPGSAEASCSEEEVPGEDREQNSKKGRRNRTSFSAEQLEVLEAAFTANTYPDQEEREQIAAKTGLSEDKIMVTQFSIMIYTVLYQFVRFTY